MSELLKCRITIIKRTINRDLIDKYAADEYKDIKPCEQFEEGQSFVIDDVSKVPDNFCAWAWADIRKDLLSLATGSNIPGYNQKGITISGCSDWFRPVYFEIKRLDNP